MIHRIEIENFQNHKQTTLGFHPGVNIISGPSDNGKSAIIRALRWVIQNKPQGDSFRKEGTKKTSVQITFDDGSLSRTKTDKENFYSAGEETFKAMKGSVPEELSEFMNVPESCIQHQHASYFLLTESPGEVARKINELADLSIIDKSIKKATSIKNQVQSEIKFVKKEVAKIELQLEEYIDLDQIQKILSRLNITKDEYIELTEEQKALSILFSDYNEKEERVVKLEWVKDAISELDELEVKAKELSITQTSFDFLKKNIAVWRHLDSKIHSFSKVFDKEEIQRLQDEGKELKALEKKYSSLVRFRKEIKETGIRFARIPDTDKIGLQIKELQKRLEICPTCGKPL